MEQQGSVDKESLIGTGNSYMDRDGVSSSENVHMTTINNDETRKTNENTSDKPSIPHIYRQDIVKSKGSGMIGIVTEVAGDADSDSDITDDEDEDEDEDGGDGEDDDGCDDDDGDGEKVGQNKENYGDDSNAKNSNRDNYKSQPLPDDEVRVLWMDESETTPNVNDLTVIDRGFLHGDFVAAVSDPTGQAGVVVDVNISVDLLVPDGSIMKDISSKDLKRVRDFTVGDYVVLGPWLGRIDDVLDNVTVMFDDGSKCKVTRSEETINQPERKLAARPGGESITAILRISPAIQFPAKIMTTSRRLADRKVGKFDRNITRRGAVPETTVKKGKDYPVGPLLLGFFIFVVIGSSLFQIIRTATGGGMA